MAGSKQDPTGSFVLSDDIGCCGSGKNGILSDDEFGDTVCRPDFQDRLYGFRREVATISSDDKGRALDFDRVKDRLDEVFRIVLVEPLGQG